MQFEKIVKLVESVVEGFGATFTTEINHQNQNILIYFNNSNLVTDFSTFLMDVWCPARKSYVNVDVCKLKMDSSEACFGGKLIETKNFEDEFFLRDYLSEQLAGYIKQRAELLQSLRKSLIDQI